MASLTVTPEAEAALRRVTYEEMLDDWLRLNEKLAAPVGMPTDIKTPFLNYLVSKFQQYSI